MSFHLHQSFTSGEVSRRIDVRTEFAKRLNGCRVLRNAYSLPHGPAIRRPGTRFIAEVKDSTKETFLGRFEFSEEQAYILEFGEYYIRFYMDRGQVVEGSPDDWATATAYVVDDYVSNVSAWLTAQAYVVDQCVTNGGITYRCLVAHTSSVATELTGANWTVATHTTYRCLTANTSAAAFETDLAAGKWEYEEIYTITTPYLQSELSDLTFAQSADELYIVHNNHPQAVLTRTGHTAWTIADIEWTVQPFISAYNEYTITPSAISGSITLTASGSMFVADHVGSVFKVNDGEVTITAYTSATQVTGTVGDDNLSGTSADNAWMESEWSEVRGYPSCVSFFEQRLSFAGSTSRPQTAWLSKSADYFNFDTGTAADDDACVYTISSDQVNIITWLMQTDVLLLGTNGGVWIMAGASGDVLTPSSVRVTRDTSRGAQRIKPLNVGPAVLYVQKFGKIVRELAYSFENNSYQAVDLSILSEHLTRKNKIIDSAYQETPFSIIWYVTDAGGLIGLTYQRQHEVVGWHRHDTHNGLFESIASIPGEDEDEIWFIVKRTINGVTKRYVELLGDVWNPEEGDNAEDCFYVDCALSYDGVAISEVTAGLEHLEAEEVDLLADGALMELKTVEDGGISLDSEAEKIHIGLPMVSDFQPAPAEMSLQDGTSVGRVKRITNTLIEFENTISAWVGPDADNLEETMFHSADEPDNEPSALFTGTHTFAFQEGYYRDATVFIRQSRPLPMCVLGVVSQVEVYK